MGEKLIGMEGNGGKYDNQKPFFWYGGPQLYR